MKTETVERADKTAEEALHMADDDEKARIAQIFAPPSIDVLDIEVPDTDLARLASYPLPLIAALRFSAGVH